MVLPAVRTRADVARPERTPEGYLDVDAYLARDGLLQYSDGKNSWLEYRPREELVAAAATWALVPVTDDHPPVMVDAENARIYTRGLVVTTPRVVDADGVAYLAARLRVIDSALVQRILAGQREISIGFLADVHPERGVVSGKRYDAVQRALAGNHVASVEAGRAGPAVRILLDSAHGAESCYCKNHKDHEAPNVKNHTKRPVARARKSDRTRASKSDEVGNPTTLSTIQGPDGEEVQVPTWVAALVAEALDAHEAGEPAEPIVADEDPEEKDPLVVADEDPEEKDPLVADEDPEEEKKMTPDAIRALVRRRGRLERLAVLASIPTAVIDASNDTALARAYVSRVLPHAKAIVASARGDALRALVDMAAATPVPVATNPFEQAQKLDALDPSDDPIVAAYAAHMTR